MPDYEHEQEFKALVSPAVREAIAASGFQRIAFSCNKCIITGLLKDPAGFVVCF